MKMYRRATQLTHSCDGVPDVVLQMRGGAPSFSLLNLSRIACERERERKATGGPCVCSFQLKAVVYKYVCRLFCASEMYAVSIVCSQLERLHYLAWGEWFCKSPAPQLYTCNRTICQTLPSSVNIPNRLVVRWALDHKNLNIGLLLVTFIVSAGIILNLRQLTKYYHLQDVFLAICRLSLVCYLWD